MKNKPQPPEYNERTAQQAAIETPASQAHEINILIDYLLEEGFAWEEATKLLHLHEHLCENSEVRQRLADDHHMQFARWLYEQGEISEA